MIMCGYALQNLILIVMTVRQNEWFFSMLKNAVKELARHVSAFLASLVSHQLASTPASGAF